MPFMLSIAICLAQQSSRQVVLGGQKLPEVHLGHENDPLQLLKEKNPIKSAMRNNPTANHSYNSPCEPLIADACVACGTCAIGTCVISTACPQSGLICNCVTNCLFSSFLLGYWIHDQPDDITSGQFEASCQYLVKLKQNISSFLGFKNEKTKSD